MNQLLQTINSREVAKMVERDHSKVIRDTRGLIEHLTKAKIGLSNYFVESTYEDSTGRKLPCF
ncbi:TPA: Rha family transcriptional regulator [Enterococcus faecalis]